MARKTSRFWGCMSINDRAAASVAGHSSTQREYETNRDAMHFVVDQIHQVCIPLPWLFADGVTRMGEARFAYAVGYQLAQDKLLLHLLPVTSQPATHSVALLVCRPTAANIPRVPRSRRHGAAAPCGDHAAAANCAVDLPCNHAHGPGNSVHVHT